MSSNGELFANMKNFEPEISRRRLLALMGASAGSAIYPAWAENSSDIAPQPYFAGVSRAIEALSELGSPLSAADAAQLAALIRQGDRAAVAAAEEILARYTLANVSIETDGAMKIEAGGAPRILVEQGWRLFLVRVANIAGRADNITLPAGTSRGTPGKVLPDLFTSSFSVAERPFLPDRLSVAPMIEEMWLLAQLHGTTPAILGNTVVPAISLSGFTVEYLIAQIFSREAGHRRGSLTLQAFPRSGTDSGGYGSSGSRELDFESLPSRTVTLSVLDADGRGCVGSLTIKDKAGRIYPPQVMRLAPDMVFQQQIYRADGETVLLPDGEYIVKSKRGPEYLRGVQTVVIDNEHTRMDVGLKRWIDPAKWGWYSGDTHIHAAGCLHYQSPTEGVSPETIIRHARGEALSVADVLTWGSSWYYQKQFFSGKAESPEATLEHPELQAANHATLQPRSTPEDSESLLRYDVEVSGFPSSHCGHLVLLRLKDQDYPGTKVIEDWPSWNLPVLKWAKAQGAVVGYAHCGDLGAESKELPNYEIPSFESNGTNEAFVDVTHDAVDFLSGGNVGTAPELNGWYHLLNCGFKLAMAGETDYPCLSPPHDSRPGIGRSYVRLDRRPTDDAGYDDWVRNLQLGRNYHGDGRTHFLEFTVNGRTSGERLVLRGAASVTISATVAAYLEAEPSADTQVEKEEVPWHIERARIGLSREVPLELIVNGVAVERIDFLADGAPRMAHFKAKVTRSSWIALRILPSGHTHPVYIDIAGKPIRASRRSAEWCRACVDKLWDVKSPFMRASERPDAAAAFDHARKVYDAIIDECEVV